MGQSYVKALLVINRSSCCGGASQTLHKSRHAAKAPPNMQSYLQAKNAECAPSYAKYATERALSLFSHSLYPYVCVSVCVRLGNQAASRSAAIKDRNRERNRQPNVL